MTSMSPNERLMVAAHNIPFTHSLRLWSGCEPNGAKS